MSKVRGTSERAMNLPMFIIELPQSKAKHVNSSSSIIARTNFHDGSAFKSVCVLHKQFPGFVPACVVRTNSRILSADSHIITLPDSMHSGLWTGDSTNTANNECYEFRPEIPGT